MAASKLPKDVLGLGRHLVRELGFEDGVDTLGRWMSHHLAELLRDAEKAKTAADRANACSNALKTIFKIWEHRASLPGNAYPLAPYRDVMAVLSRLRPGSNPFRRYRPRGDGEDELAADLFDCLSRLVIALLLMKTRNKQKPANVDKAVFRSLSKEEQQIVAAIRSWNGLFLPSPTKTKTKRSKGNTKQPQSKEFNLDSAALQLIDSTIESLNELRSVISNRKDQPHHSPA
jgi:hypothetical protein